MELTTLLSPGGDLRYYSYLFRVVVIKSVQLVEHHHISNVNIIVCRSGKLHYIAVLINRLSSLQQAMCNIYTGTY